MNLRMLGELLNVSGLFGGIRDKVVDRLRSRYAIASLPFATAEGRREMRRLFKRVRKAAKRQQPLELTPDQVQMLEQLRMLFDKAMRRSDPKFAGLAAGPDDGADDAG